MKCAFINFFLTHLSPKDNILKYKATDNKKRMDDTGHSDDNRSKTIAQK